MLQSRKWQSSWADWCIKYGLRLVRYEWYIFKKKKKKTLKVPFFFFFLGGVDLWSNFVVVVVLNRRLRVKEKAMSVACDVRNVAGICGRSVQYVTCQPFLLFNGVPVGSPSRGGDVTVYVRHNQLRLPTPFYSVLVSVSVFMALSTVFRSINSPDNPLFSHSSLCSSGLISLLYWSFQLHISLWKSPSALI